jgi:phage tail sheath gpL-like
MASPNISFTSIPSGIRKPGVYVEQNTSNALQGLTAANDKIVILAQRLATGSISAKIPTKVFSDADSALFFGTGSVAHLTTRALFEVNPYADLTVVGVDDNGTTKATGTLAIAGTAVRSGTIDLWVGDQHVSAGVSAGDTSATVATAIKTSLDAVQSYLPSTYSLATSTATLTFTARNAGTVGNQTVLSAKNTSDCTATVTSMASGATDPDVGNYSDASTVLAAITSGGYSIIASTFSDSANLAKIKTMVDFVSGPMEQRPAICAFGYTDKIGSQATLITLAGTTLNHSRSTVAYCSYLTDSGAKTEAYKLAAKYAGVLASQSDPAVPYDGLPLTNAAVPSVTDRFSRTVQETQLNGGVTPLVVGSGDTLTVCRAISTYTTNSSNVADPVLLDITTIRTLDYVRAQVITRLTSRFQRAKLSSRTAASVRDQVLDVLYKMEALEIVQNVKTYASGVIVETDTQDPTRLDIKIPTNIVSGLHVVAAVINLIL